ncbi:phage protein Gp13 family protein [Pseudomonas sp. Irchel 3E20]|uniref:phage protein Gp13 family protein n=1 Tax=Pseudomonas sp. Irchel 3E20 TaxID=2008983 RepID=UPI000BA3BD77|nr:phage protein Gp13 family protein [Pseudomonas sp. Irchel 3E20]
MAAEVLPVSVEDVPAILLIVRQADVDEITEALGIPMERALIDAVTGSLNARKIVVDGEVVAVFGDAIHSILGSVGVPWLISTIHVEKHARAFLKVCKPEVQGMLTRHRHLMNYVDARNTSAIRWLKWLGFDFGEAAPYGARRFLFYQFTLNRGN